MLTSAAQRSPFSNPFTLAPISTTTPIASCPGMSYTDCVNVIAVWLYAPLRENIKHTGNLAINSPSWMCASVPHTPQHVTFAERCAFSHVRDRPWKAYLSAKHHRGLLQEWGLVLSQSPWATQPYPISAWWDKCEWHILRCTRAHS